MALGAVVCATSLGAACGGDAESTTPTGTVAPGGSDAIAAGAATSATAPSVSTDAAGASTTTVAYPASLVGTWRRTVTKADVARASANSYVVGRCTLTVGAGGEAKLACPFGGFTGKLIPTGDGEVQIAMGTTLPNAYAWVVDGRRLTLTKRDDPTPDRVAAMEGIWRRA